MMMMTLMMMIMKILTGSWCDFRAELSFPKKRPNLVKKNLKTFPEDSKNLQDVSSHFRPCSQGDDTAYRAHWALCLDKG